MLMQIVWWCFVAVVVLGSLDWLFYCLYVYSVSMKIPLISSFPAEPAEEEFPAVSIVIAARDEGATIEQALRSVLALDYPRLSVIVVNDRSSDETASILERMSQSFPQLRVVTITSLPERWLGKTWAMQSGAELAEPGWILFTDADVVFEPTSLRRAIRAAQDLGADHVAALPRVLLESWGERCFYSLFLILFGVHAPARLVEKRSTRQSLGIGAFNLVKRDVFQAIGGCQRLALSIDEDLRFGQALKFAGYQTRVLDGWGNLAVRWQVGTWGMIRGMEKNFFATFDFRIATAVFVTLALSVVGFGPLIGLLVGPNWLRIVACVGIAFQSVALGWVSHRSEIPWYQVWVIPASTALMIVTLVRSTYLTLIRKGVVWREHLYPIKDLKAHVALRNRWLRELWLSTR